MKICIKNIGVQPKLLSNYQYFKNRLQYDTHIMILCIREIDFTEKMRLFVHYKIYSVGDTWRRLIGE